MRILVAAVAASVALSGLVAAPARAAVTQPSGRLCSFRGVTNDDGASWTYVLDGGPLLLTDEDDPSVVRTGTVTCSLRLANSHTAPVHAAATSSRGTGYAVLPPTAVATGPEPDHLVPCAEVEVDGTRLYWQDPGDRNADGWWTTDPNVPCAQTTRTLDIRPEDHPTRWVFSALATGLGEADPAVAAADAAACSVPGVAEALRDWWWCGYPSTASSVSFVRLAAGGAVLRTAPAGWSCTDVHTGLAVARGSLLVTPAPGVSCVPPPAYGVGCAWVQVSGYLAPTTFGRVALTNDCGGLRVTRRLAAAQGRLVEQWSGNYGWAAPPLRCSADEDTTPAEPAYVALCTFL